METDETTSQLYDGYLPVMKWLDSGLSVSGFQELKNCEPRSIEMRVSTSAIEEERLWFLFLARFGRSVVCCLGDLRTGP